MKQKQSFQIRPLYKLNRLPIWKMDVTVSRHVFRAPTCDRLASLWMYKLGILGKEERRILRGFLRPGMNVIDIGANQGLYTSCLAELVKPGKVFAFEPEPMLFRQLVSNISQNRINNVICYQTAVSNVSGLLTLQSGKLNLGDNRVVAQQGVHLGGTTVVNAAALDDLLAGETIHFLKIDIQGWEAHALAGARQLLEKNRDIILMFEFWPFGLTKAGTEPEALLSSLREVGFNLYRSVHGRWSSLETHLPPRSNNRFCYYNIIGARDATAIEEMRGSEFLTRLGYNKNEATR
jgi:FkbM family methyltransferase